MRLYVRFFIALGLLLFAISCGQTAEQTTPAAAPQEAPESTSTPSAAEPAAPAGGTVAPAESATRPNTAAPSRPATEPRASAPSNTAATPAAAPASRIVRIPAGTTLVVAMIDAVGTDTNKAGDTFFASIAEPVVVGGRTALARGTKVQGRIETVDEPGRVRGRAAISLVLTQILGRERAQNITTEPFSAVAEQDVKDDAIKGAGGAAVGAVVGAIIGGKKGAAIGAATGGAGTVLATKGDQIKIESETRVNFVLRNAVDVETGASPS